MKKTPLAKQSKKHAPANRKAAKQRAAYLGEHPLCAVCLLRFKPGDARIKMASEIHHMANRSAKRCDLYEVKANWLPVSRAAHDELHADLRGTAQLAVDAKRLATPEDFSLEVLQVLNWQRFGECR